MTIFQAIVIGVVEGLTEFLPISSTGHMILTSAAFGIAEDDFTKLFEISIQLGAILAVVILYRNQLFRAGKDLWMKLLYAVMPALVLGFLFAKKIDYMLEKPIFVAWTMVLGGVILLFVDRWFQEPKCQNLGEVTVEQSVKIGFWQVLAMIPGVSRSGATIIGGMQQGLSRKIAAEFSFFLAIPTMCAATGYKMLKALKTDHHLITDHIGLLLIGNLVAFVVGVLAMKGFVGYLKKHGFRFFGVYRIVVGLAVFAAIYSGHLA